MGVAALVAPTTSLTMGDGSTTDSVMVRSAAMPTTIEDWEQVSLVPKRRLGALLSSARVERGLTLDEVAGRAGASFSLATLASIERGTRACSDVELRTLSQLYGLE